jgi:hypothetical protein
MSGRGIAAGAESGKEHIKKYAYPYLAGKLLLEMAFSKYQSLRR